MKEYKKLIKFPVLRYSIEVVFTDDVTASSGKRGADTSNEDDNENTGACHLYHADKNRSSLIFPLIPCYADIVHESYHAVHCMLTHIAAQHDEEMFAYHIGHLSEQIIKTVERRKKKKECRNKTLIN